MAESTNEEVVHAYLAAMKAADQDAMGAIRHPDWVSEWPQSGERVRGHVNMRAIDEHYPGGLPDMATRKVVGSEDRWVVTPMFTHQRVVGSGDAWWVDGTMAYPDGSTWFVAMLLELLDGRIYRETVYFGEPFESPAWRAAWVERMD